MLYTIFSRKNHFITRIVNFWNRSIKSYFMLYMASEIIVYIIEPGRTFKFVLGEKIKKRL